MSGPVGARICQRSDPQMEGGRRHLAQGVVPGCCKGSPGEVARQSHIDRRRLLRERRQRHAAHRPHLTNSQREPSPHRQSSASLSCVEEIDTSKWVVVLAQGPSPRAPVVRRSARSGARRVSPACPSPREASPSPSPPVRFDPQRRRLLGSPGGRVTAYTGAAGAWAHLSCCGPRFGSDVAQRIRVCPTPPARAARLLGRGPAHGRTIARTVFSGVWVSDVQGWHLPSPRRAALGGGCRMSRRGLSPRQGG